MKRLSIKLQHCYGIKKLEKELEFSKRTFSIYAPNGVMKTSLAKTFLDIQKEKETADLHFPERETIVNIEVGNENSEDEIIFDPIQKNQVFVIEPYNADYESDKLSTLLVNEQLRKDYEKEYKDIENAKKDLIKKLKQLSGLTGRNDNIEGVIESIFDKNIFELLLDDEFETFINKEESKLDFVIDKIIFNDKVLKILKDSAFIKELKEYVEKYNELIGKSEILQKDFTINHATTVQDQLKKNNFFNAGHYINLLGIGEVKSDDDFASTLTKEKQKILEDDELLKKFEKINNKFSNQELKTFRDFLTENKDIIPFFENLEELRKTIWLSYFIKEKDLISNLRNVYIKAKEKIQNILQQAKAEKTEWEKVVDTFNNKFSHLPFCLKVENKEDVLLKKETPSISFIFKDGDEEKSYDNKKDLIDKLSTGEKRALYILNIIFEIEARKKDDQEIIIIVDDIADSFDYKNKYAIIEYLKEISEFDRFYIIILTHNFDFFRSIKGRLNINWQSNFIAIKKDNDEIDLKSIIGESVINPFANWKSSLTDNKKLIAFIPFVRNIIEYTQGSDNEDYISLTNCLHDKEHTDNIILSDLKIIFEKYVQNIDFPTENNDKRIIDLIFETAEVCLTEEIGINLENKIVLSIAIRLKAEKFMKSRISTIGEISKSQTWFLLKKYRAEFDNEVENIELLKRVNLITPENIHLNSFMYEPILDMGDNELKKIYIDIKDKLIINE